MNICTIIFSNAYQDTLFKDLGVFNIYLSSIEFMTMKIQNESLFPLPAHYQKYTFDKLAKQT
jgi:hypothetical protein